MKCARMRAHSDPAMPHARSSWSVFGLYAVRLATEFRHVVAQLVMPPPWRVVATARARTCKSARRSTWKSMYWLFIQRSRACARSCLAVVHSARARAAAIIRRAQHPRRHEMRHAGRMTQARSRRLAARDRCLHCLDAPVSRVRPVARNPSALETFRRRPHRKEPR